jgi:hypothetical protein
LRDHQPPNLGNFVIADLQRPMWAMAVGVLDVLLQHQREVAWSGDQLVIEATDVGAGEHGVEGGDELGVSVADQVPELLGAVAEVDQ